MLAAGRFIFSNAAKRSVRDYYAHRHQNLLGFSAPLYDEVPTGVSSGVLLLQMSLLYSVT